MQQHRSKVCRSASVAAGALASGWVTAVSIACLTIYDMVKAVERGIRIEGIRLLHKSGGKSGEWNAGG